MPARAGMLLGASAAVYAISLAGVAALQAADDAAIAARRQPFLDAIAASRAANDALEASITGADARSSALADRYGIMAADVTAYESDLDALAALVAKVEGSAAALPSRISLPSVRPAGPIASRSSGRSSPPRPRPGRAPPAAEDHGGGRGPGPPPRARRRHRPASSPTPRARSGPSCGCSSGAVDRAPTRVARVPTPIAAPGRCLGRGRGPSSTPSTSPCPGSATTASSARSTGSPAPAAWSASRGGCARRSRSMHRAGRIDRRPVRRLGARPRSSGSASTARRWTSRPWTGPRAAHPAPGADADGLERPRPVPGAREPGRHRRDREGPRAPLGGRSRDRRSCSRGAGVLLDAGGDLVAAGEPPPGGWRVGIEDPAAAGRRRPPRGDRCSRAARSRPRRSRVRRWTDPDGVPVHHLVDPRSGTSARTGLIAVTVAGADPAWAEVWTKALFLAGRRRDRRRGAGARDRGLVGRRGRPAGDDARGARPERRGSPSRAWDRADGRAPRPV